MKDKPILFSVPMVRALLDGRKMMTRRIVKPHPQPKPPLPAAHAAPGSNRPPTPPQPRHRPAAATGAVTARQQRFLDAAATLTYLEAEVTRETVCGWIGVHPRGGSVGEELGALEAAGMITVVRGQITVTPDGLAAACTSSQHDAVASARSGLSPRQARIFDIIVTAWPDSMAREDIAAIMNIHPRGGSFGEDIARLVGRGLATSERGRVRARDFIMAGRKAST